MALLEILSAMPGKEEITILHFNDVYNVEPQDMEPPGGAARFKTAIQSFAHLNPLVVFSGDALNPSLMSTFTKGQQMNAVLNACGVQVAVYGNHDFDHGVDELVDFSKQCPFPWLLSNVIDNETGEPLAEGKLTHMIEWCGVKFGFIGLVEEEWLATLSTIEPEDITYIDYVEQGRQFSKQLRDEGAEYVIALTHMRTPNDVRLAENVDEIDLILGGHDHCFEVSRVNNKYIVKSGSDFRQLGKISLTLNSEKIDIDIEEITIDSRFSEDPFLKEVVDEFMKTIEEKMEGILGHVDTDLDGRFNMVRTQETNLGNLIADVMQAATHANVALYNSGTLRSDRIHYRGNFSMRDLVTILPMVDELVVLKISGEHLLNALENGVSQYPKLEGRFPQVAGISFGFDPEKPPGRRVNSRYVKVGDEYIQMDKYYSLVTKNYIASGKDGYDVLSKCEVLVNNDDCPNLTTSVQNHFKSVNIVRGVTPCRSHHRQSLVSLHRRNTLLHMGLSHSTLDSSRCSTATVSSTELNMLPESGLDVQSTPTHPDLVQSCFNDLTPEVRKRRRKLRRQVSVHEHELNCSRLAPEIDGRIIVLNDRSREALEHERVQYDVTAAIYESDESNPSCLSLESDASFVE